MNRSIRAAVWLGESDAAAVELARQLARTIDSADDSRTAWHHGNALMQVLRALWLTPESRPERLKSGQRAPLTALDELRQRRL